MKLFVTLLALTVSWAIVHVNAQGNNEEAWKTYQLIHPTKAKNQADFQKRKSKFFETQSLIEKHNRNKNCTYKMGHNKFSTMNDTEVKKHLNSLPPIPFPEEMLINETTISDLNITTRQLPSSVDYRCHPCMQPVKDQGLCGSCWSFAATAPIEFRKCYNTPGYSSVSFSEQQLLDCSLVNQWGCAGGYIVNAWQYLIQVGGQTTSAVYPYNAVSGTCKFNTGMIGVQLSTAKIGAFTPFTANTISTMQFYLNSGYLIGVVIDVVMSFYTYKSGIYNDPYCSNTASDFVGNHAINIVGYGTASNGMNYWVIRNSWGAAWGVAGYAYFQRGVNMCRIEQFAVIILF